MSAGRVSILFLDLACSAFRGPQGRSVFEADTVGRLAAELNTSLYILADIRKHVGQAAFDHLEVRFHQSDPDRSLIMLDVGASMDNGCTPEEIVAAHPKGIILENPYPRRRGERGLEGEGCSFTAKRGGGENGRPIVVPENSFIQGVAG